MKEISEPLVLLVDNNGNSYYEFNDSLCGSQRNSVRLLHSNHGWALASFQKGYKPGDAITICSSTCFVPTGSKKGHLCCFCGGLVSKVVAPSIASSLHYCGRNCLNSDNGFLEVFGSVYSEIERSPSRLSDRVDELLLLIRILYQHSVELDYYGHPYTLMKYLSLCVNSSEPLSQSQSVIDEFITVLRHQEQAFSFLDSQLSLNVCAMLPRLLRSIRYNSFSIPVPNVADTFILSMNPVLARINHSCQPNCLVQYRCSTQHSLVLKCIRPVAPGEELSISYLSDLAVPLLDRRDLLFSGFHFRCECSRCLLEESNALIWSAKSLESCREQFQRSEWAISTVVHFFGLCRSAQPTSASYEAMLALLGELLRPESICCFDADNDWNLNESTDMCDNDEMLEYQRIFRKFGADCCRQHSIITTVLFISDCWHYWNCYFLPPHLTLLLRGVTSCAAIAKFLSLDGDVGSKLQCAGMEVLRRAEEVVAVFKMHVESEEEARKLTYSDALRKITSIKDQYLLISRCSA